MNCLYLSGNSVQNKDWIIEIEKKFADLFDKSFVQYYKHWEDDGEVIDIMHEQSMLLQISPNLGKEYVIFAKSIGTYLAAKCIKENILKPQKCIFVGLPVDWARDKHFSIDWAFKDFEIPSLFIHHTNDPVTSAESAKNFINNSSIKNYKFKELDGDSHDYPEFDILKSLVNDFVFKK